MICFKQMKKSINKNTSNKLGYVYRLIVYELIVRQMCSYSICHFIREFPKIFIYLLFLVRISFVNLRNHNKDVVIICMKKK